DDDDDDGNGGGGSHIDAEDAESFSDSSSDTDGTLDETVIDMSASEDCLLTSDILTTTQG
ncbi:MAG: hypothetical protein J6X49_18405, partial [Victivallales bacterium]|nr:hypothetical protein [Victivallales bacterium]